MKIFYLPDLGEGLAEAEIREWYVKEGEMVKVDQPLVSMETAKAVVDVPSPYSGKIAILHGKVNDVIATGSELISFESEEETKKSPDKGSVVGKLETSEKKWDENEVIVGSHKKNQSAIKAMPAARVLAKEMNIDLSLITATGPNGLITPDDVKKFFHHQTQTSSSKEGSEILHGVRRTMAQVMAQSHQVVVPVTVTEDADITHLSNIDMTARLIQAICLAAKDEPALNARFDGKTLERKLNDAVHLGLAMDTAEGLFVPVIKNAQTQDTSSIRKMIDEYKESVKNRKISSENLHGATITLTNFGTIAGRYATPIVVPPTVAIIGCGRSRDAAIVSDGKISVGRIMPLSLTFDHRAVTGGEAVRSLNALIKHLIA